MLRVRKRTMPIFEQRNLRKSFCCKKNIIIKHFLTLYSYVIFKFKLNKNKIKRKQGNKESIKKSFLVVNFKVI